jgi:hypothetical protein
MRIIQLSDTPDKAITDHDLAELAEWASKMKHLSFREPQVAKSYAMIREAADTILRARALGARGQEPTQK